MQRERKDLARIAREEHEEREGRRKTKKKIEDGEPAQELLDVCVIAPGYV